MVHETHEGWQMILSAKRRIELAFEDADKRPRGMTAELIRQTMMGWCTTLLVPGRPEGWDLIESSSSMLMQAYGGIEPTGIQA